MANSKPALDFRRSDLAISCHFCEHGSVNKEQENLILDFVVGRLDAFERGEAIALLRSEPAVRSFFLDAAQRNDFKIDELEASDADFINRILDSRPQKRIVSKTNFLGQQYSPPQILEFFVGALVGLLLIGILLFALFRSW